MRQKKTPTTTNHLVKESIESAMSISDPRDRAVISLHSCTSEYSASSKNTETDCRATLPVHHRRQYAAISDRDGRIHRVRSTALRAEGKNCIVKDGDIMIAFFTSGSL